jgi:O-methyltransferase involved in polyketide biosynthesis
MPSSWSNKSTDLGERPKEKVFLKGSEETLFATLLPKARDAASPKPILGDPYAQRLIDSCDVDLTRSTFKAMDNERAIRWVVHRARCFDRWCQDFLQKYKYEPVTVVHMACGLDCRVFRTRPGANVRWIDLDREHVIHLRQRLITQPPPNVDYSMRTLDVTNPGWMRDRTYISASSPRGAAPMAYQAPGWKKRLLTLILQYRTVSGR